MTLDEAKATGKPFKRPSWDKWVHYIDGSGFFDADTAQAVSFGFTEALATDFEVRET